MYVCVYGILQMCMHIIFVSLCIYFLRRAVFQLNCFKLTCSMVAEEILNPLKTELPWCQSTITWNVMQIGILSLVCRNILF